MLSSACEIVEHMPTVAGHRALFEAVGWTPSAPPAAEQALRNSLLGVVALYEGEVVGMARVAGDGGKFFYAQDFAMQPAHQGQGIGRSIMDHVPRWIKIHVPHEPFVGLFATQAAVPFYRRYGFDEQREVLSGMWTVLPADNRPAPSSP